MKSLIKREEVEKRERKAAKLEWRNDMREQYGRDWDKRTANRVASDGNRRMGAVINSLVTD